MEKYYSTLQHLILQETALLAVPDSVLNSPNVIIDN